MSSPLDKIYTLAQEYEDSQEKAFKVLWESRLKEANPQVEKIRQGLEECFDIKGVKESQLELIRNNDPETKVKWDENEYILKETYELSLGEDTPTVPCLCEYNFWLSPLITQKRKAKRSERVRVFAQFSVDDSKSHAIHADLFDEDQADARAELAYGLREDIITWIIAHP